MAIKEAWISEKEIDDILDIIDRDKLGKIELSCYNDAMYSFYLYFIIVARYARLLQPILAGTI